MKGELEACKIEEKAVDDIPIEIQNAFRKILKKGIYKELYRRNLLSDAQLNSLLNDN